MEDDFSFYFIKFVIWALDSPFSQIENRGNRKWGQLRLNFHFPRLI